MYSRLLPLSYFVLFWISSTAAQFPETWRTTRRTSWTSRPFTSRHPCGALAMYMFYASTFMYQTLCHLCNNEFILIIYSLYMWHVLWYLDNSVVYMRDLILAHIWLLGLCPLYTGCDRIGIKAVSTIGRRPRLELVELRSLSPTLLAEIIFYIYSLDSWNFSFPLLGFSLDFVLW